MLLLLGAAVIAFVRGKLHLIESISFHEPGNVRNSKLGGSQ